MIGVVLAIAVAAATSAPLDECRRLEQAFDTAAMPAPCMKAVDDVALPVADRVDAARLLAFAIVTNGDPDGGEAAFLRLLVLAPGWTQPASASPRLRDAFARARARLTTDGAVTAAATATGESGGWALDVDVIDPLGRVAGGEWSLTDPAGAVAPATGSLVRAPGTQRWMGRLPASAASTCVVHLRAADGTELAAAPCTGLKAAGTAEPPASEFPWVAVGLGVGAVVGGAVVIGVVWALNAGPLAPPAAVTVTVQ
jgi:hypothetical protein